MYTTSFLSQIFLDVDNPSYLLFNQSLFAQIWSDLELFLCSCFYARFTL